MRNQILNSYKNIKETAQFFYHSDHLGSSSFITNVSGNADQFLQYMPYGELLVDQRSTDHGIRYKFTGKERDEKTPLVRDFIAYPTE